MFSLKRRLSSRSSWVMWHHFSLWTQEGQDGIQNGLGPSLPALWSCLSALPLGHRDLPWQVISTRACHLPGESQTPLGISSLPKTKSTTFYCPGDLGGPWPLTAFPSVWSTQWARKPRGARTLPGILGPDAQGSIYRRHKNGSLRI